MASIVLRAASSDFSVDSFLQSHSSLEPEAVWHVGETKIPGRTPAATSGFNLRLADDDGDVAALKQARVEIARYRAALEQLRDADVRTCIDVGLFVGAEFSRNLPLGPNSASSEHRTALFTNVRFVDTIVVNRCCQTIEDRDDVLLDLGVESSPSDEIHRVVEPGILVIPVDDDDFPRERICLNEPPLTKECEDVGAICCDSEIACLKASHVGSTETARREE